MVQTRRLDRLAFRGLSVVEPLGLEIIAAGLPDHDVRIVDMLLDNRIVDALKEFHPDIVGINCSFTMEVYQSLDIARQAKQSETRPFVVIGGHHATLNPHDFNSDSVDAIAIGEGEVTMRDLVSCLHCGGDLHGIAGLVLNENGRQHATTPRQMLANLNDSPPPRRELTKKYRDRYFMVFEKPLATVETARGCPHRCDFCSVWRFYQGKCRYKSAEVVVEELASVREPVVFFTDDNFLLDVKRAREIARLIKEYGIRKRYFFQARSDTIVQHPDLILAWKEIGMGGVFIGMEKVDEAELAAIHKRNHVENNTKAAAFLLGQNLGLTASFIVDPTYTRSDFEKIRAYIRQRKIVTPSFTVLTPLPGTELFDEVRDRLQTDNYELFDLLHSVLPTKMDLPDFYQEFSHLYGSAYTTGRLVKQGVGPFIKELVLGRQSLRHFRLIARSSTILRDPQAYLADHYAPHPEKPSAGSRRPALPT